MSDESSDELPDDWIMYCDREEWNDVTPLPQPDSTNSVVTISYSDRYKDVHDYLRAMMARNEISDRALLITTDAITLNPANYNTWQYRRKILKGLNSDLQEELEFIDSVTRRNLKNYQVWHHRRTMVEWIGNGQSELDFTRRMLNMDWKNYHAWQHRNWAVATFQLWSGEMAVVEEALYRDARNNSAWNYRFFILSNDGDSKCEPSDCSLSRADVLQREVRYALDAVRQITHNESAWNYLRGVLLRYGTNGLNDAEVMDTLEAEYAAGCRTNHLLAFMADAAADAFQQNPHQQIHFQKALQYMDLLANEFDVIRQNYWKYLMEELTEKEQTK